MPKAARSYEYNSSNGYYGYQRPYPSVVTPTRPKLKPIRPKKHARVQKHINPFAKLLSTMLICAIGIFVLPYSYNRLVAPLITGTSYPEVKVNYQELYSPTTNYLSNDLVLNTRLLTGAETKNPKMSKLYLTTEMPALKANLKRLSASYPSIQSSIFVWDFETGKYVDIDSTKVFSAASIIKLPILIQLFKSIEANQLTIYDNMELTPYYKADGSGVLKNSMSGAQYTIDELAKIMIQKSDNSATNMLMSEIGGMPDVNNGIRSWGLKSTYVRTWLPDLEGTNYTTTKDLATMLYNLDNPGFLNINSREYIIDYMSHVENNRLIQAGLDPKALFVHKTGDIGKMLGDAGIVFTPNGKKYIVAILANRPYNSPQGKNFIQQASSLIYKSIIAGCY